MATDNLMPQSSTSIIKHFMLRSSTTGQGLTGKVHSDFSGKYNIAGGAEVTLSFSSGTAGDAYSSGKICPLGLGKYAWHVPNAVFASLGNVSAVLSVTDGIDVHCEWLVVVDNRELATKPVNVTQIGGNTQSATDLKDFADTGYDPSAHKVQGVVLVDTTTTNSDMRGTDNAALAATALSTSVWTSTIAGRIDAAISTRSTYAGGDTAGTTTLLSRIGSAITINAGKVAAELDSATSTQINNIENASGYVLAVLAGACADPQTASETYAITVFGSTFTVDMAGQTSTGTRTAPSLTKT